MNKKQKLIILLIAFMLVIMGSGLTYAYFTSFNTSETASTIYAKGGTMNIVYANGSGNIVMENIYPRETEWVNKTFTVTGENTTDLEMEYSIYLMTKSNGFNLGDLTYSLSGTGTNVDDFLSSKENQQLPKSGEILIGSGTFKSKAATHSYNLKIYYKETGENQNNGQEKNYTGYVRIDTGSSINYNTLINQTTDTSSTSLAFNGPITRNEIETITFKSDVMIPSTALFTWDASEKQNGSIMAYTLDEDQDNLYELYIGQEKKVVLGSNAASLFASYNQTSTLDVSKLDTSNVTDMTAMFAGCNATEIKGLSTFDTSKVTNMTSMFAGSSAKTLNLSNFNTSNVTQMINMFAGTLVSVLDLSSFDISKVSNMDYMFAGSSATTGYARTQEEANIFNRNSGKPSTLTFKVKS